MKVIFDSNVLLSAGIFPNGKAAQVVDYVAAEYMIVLSNTIIDEVKRVVSVKFADRSPCFEKFLAKLTYEYAYVPEKAIEDSKLKISDPDDKHILVSAVFGGADVLITGDKHFFERKYDEIEILTPSDFMAKY